MNKKYLRLLFCFAFTAVLTAQQITRFAVDTAVVYQTYFRESAAVRNYESTKAGFQTEIMHLTDELKALQVKKLKPKRE